MMYARMLAICTIGVVCSTPALQGQGLSHYRDCELGSDVSSVSSLAGVASSEVKTESGSPLARWGDGEHTIVLYQTSSYRSAYRLIVTDIRLDDLARRAESQSLRLDDQEAPAREVARQKKERDDQRAAAAKARVANKGAFRP